MKPLTLTATLAVLGCTTPAFGQAGQRVRKPTREVQILLDRATTATPKWKDRLPILQEALSLANQKDDCAGQSRALLWLGRTYFALQSPRKAVQCFEQSLPILRMMNDRSGEATSHNNLGVLLTSLGEREEALDHYELSLSIRKSLKDYRGVAGSLSNIGAVYAELGNPKRALEYYKESLPIRRKVNDQKGEAVTLSNIASANIDLGILSEALSYSKRALDINKSSGDKEQEAITVSKLGLIYSLLGQKETALDFHRRSLLLSQAAEDRGQEASALGNIGSIYISLERPLRALPFLEKSLAIRREIEDPGGESVALNSIGSAYDDLGDKAKALEYYQNSLALSHKIGDRRRETTALNNIGSVYLNLGQPDKGLEYFEEALGLSKKLGDRHQESGLLSNISLAFRLLGQNAAAIARAKQSINVLQDMRADLRPLHQESQNSFRDSVANKYRYLAELLAEAGRIPEAQQVLDLLKDDEFFRFLHRGASEKPTLVDLTPREREWLDKYEAIGGELGKLYTERARILTIPEHERTESENARLTELRSKLDAAAAAFQIFLESARASFAQADADQERLNDLQGAQALQRTLARLPGTPVALYTLTTQDGVRIIVDLPGAVAPRQSEAKVTANDLNKKVLAFRLALQDPTLDPRPLGAELYDLLIRPIEADLAAAGADTLMWSLDGTLRYVPLWALYDDKEKKYLLEKYPSSVFTPRTVDRLVETPGGGTAFGFGVTRPAKVDDILFPALPGVAQELTALGGSTKLDDQFTMQALRSAMESGAQVLHLATHFRFLAGNDEGSFLVLGGGKPYRLSEFKNLAEGELAKVDLLVLSACDTAAGSGDGSEFESFALLAQLKGAGAVLATLWPVADDGTAALMKEFYRLRQENRAWTKLRALREAQLRLLHGEVTGPPSPGRSGTKAAGNKSNLPKWPEGTPPYAHPYYWAPFVLTGNWK